MSTIKQQFQDFREHTPKHVQWLLLGAAFLVVTILLTLLLWPKSDEDTSLKDVNNPVKFTVNPTSIDLTGAKVGSALSKSIDINVDGPVVIKDIDINANGISTKDDCEDLTTADSCVLNVIYKPESGQKATETNLNIVWASADQEDIEKTTTVTVKYSATEDKPEAKKVEPMKQPEPVVEPEPEPEIEIIEEEEPFVEEEPEPIVEDIVEEIKTIATPNPFVEKSEPAVALTPEKCSEFAIAGYDQSGRQIGWIKPEHGANYFYPFSDKECKNPTGKYDFATGVITSLKDGSKIGTDSDHIGYRNVRNRNLSMPALSAPTNYAAENGISYMSNGDFEGAIWESSTPVAETKKFDRNAQKEWDQETLIGTGKGESVTSTKPYDRTFILRQFKPIPATIVSEVRADPSIYGYDKAGNKKEGAENYSVPVRATVDRNVYSDDGRTIILPTGTLLMGYLTGELPGPYQAFGRMNIKWYQFIRPDGVEFNFDGTQDPYSADAQGRMGVPGHGSTDYVEQMVMPILTALVPAAVNMIAPITDTVINQIDLDNNTVVQSGTIRSSEMAKQDIINTWNKITQKLVVDSIDNTVPPFSIAAGTRINVFSPVDLIVSCQDVKGAKCSVIPYGKSERRKWSELKNVSFVNADDPSWKGQIRSFDLNQYCKYDEKSKKVTIADGTKWAQSGYDYRTVLAYCEAQNYQAKNNAKQEAYNKQVQKQADEKKQDYGASWSQDTGWTTNFSDSEKEKTYNTEVLGMTYDEEGNLENPFAKSQKSEAVVEDTLTCEGGVDFDENGCCPGETFTDMGEEGWNCCPDAGGDCFPPTIVE